MVEKIIVNPNEIRGYGNIHEPTVASDWSKYGSTLSKTTDTVDGATTDVFQLQPASYTLTFNSASYTTNDGTVSLTVAVKDGLYPVPNATVIVTGGGGTGTGTTNNLGTASINVTGITESGTLTAVYGFSKATATVTYQTSSYSLAFSQNTYTITMMSPAVVSCTLTSGGTPVSGETITFSWEGFEPMSSTATTNSSGVATKSFNYLDLEMYPAFVTATYDTASATCTIEDGGF